MNEKELLASIVCETCGHIVTPRKRKLNRSYALHLIQMVKKSGSTNPWLHVDSDFRDGVTASRGDYAKLRFWGLIEEKQNDDERKKCSGYWRVTDLARRFVYGAASLPSYIILKNNQVVGVSDKLIGIGEALGEPFNYSELMAA